MTDRHGARRHRRHPSGGGEPRRHRPPDATGPVRPAGRWRLPQGREPPADRRVQDPRRLPRHRQPAGRCPGSRRHHLLVRQPRPGRRPRGAAPGLPRRRRHAVRRAGHQARTGSRRTGRRSSSSAPPPTSGSASRRPSPRSAVSRSSRRTTTTGSSPGRARSASRSPRTCRMSRSCSCRSVAAGWPPGRRSAIKALVPGARVLGVEPELAADARESLARGAIVRWPADEVSRTIADGTRTQSIGDRPFAHLRVHLDGIVTVTEAEIVAGVRLAAERSRLVVEPSGALTIAALAFHATELGHDPLDGPRGRRRQRRQRGPGRLPALPRDAAPGLSVLALGRAPLGEERLASTDLGQLGRRSPVLAGRLARFVPHPGPQDGQDRRRGRSGRRPAT